jgi:hypothetical protein
MPSKPAPQKTQAGRTASLGIAWGLVAGVAYLGLIGTIVSQFKGALPQWSPPTFDSGIIHSAAAHASLAHANPSLASLRTVAVAAIPFAIVAVIALGLIARLRPTDVVFAGLLIVAACLGLAGTALVFITVVVGDASTRNGIAVAVVTIIAVPVLLRVQHFIRRFYRRSPAVVSLLFGALLLVYFIFSNNASLSSIVLSQLDYWLALAAFGIALYAGISSVRHRRAARKG